MSLSLLMVSKGEPHAWPFVMKLHQAAGRIPNCEVVICADGPDAYQALRNHSFAVHPLPTTRGFVEDILDTAVSLCRGDYVLRVDDDETLSPALVEWLAAETYYESEVLRFPRVHFWGDDRTVLMTKALYPDWQIRLTTFTMAGGREKRPHSTSPFGIGKPAPVVLEHHKFLVKTRAEREAVADRYEAARPGLGKGPIFQVFSLPEVVYAGEVIQLVSYGDGQANWTPAEVRSCILS